VSHATPDMLPSFESLQSKSLASERPDTPDFGKLIYVVRDPRDVVTSNYFFMGVPKDGWDGSMNRFLAPAEETPNAFGGWFEHVRAFEELVTRLGPERACVIEYEKMHSDIHGCLARLAKLLGPSAEATLACEGEEIQRALGFAVMKAEGANGHILRQGQLGGWRKHFSAADERRLAIELKARLPRMADSLAGLDTWR